MAANTSLVVKISADINDFTKGLDAATRGVDRAAKKIEGFGRAITLGITVPVAAAAVALAKMAAENEDTAGRMERVFGSAASSVNASIKKMMASVPEANTDLQKMAISVDNMAQGLGLAPGNAAKMSESLLKLAGDASAFAHVPMAEALDALSRGLAGKTKGLLQFGIAINEADIKAKALSMGLVHEGNELTETGTALASYALIMEKSTRITGEADRTAGQAGKQFAFLKRDLSELADNVSGLVLPALSDLAKKAREVVDWASKLDSSTVSAFFKIAAAAALLGPAIVIIVRMVDGLFKLRAAFGLLATAGGAATFAELAALPFASIVLGIGGLALALVAAADAWARYNKESGSAFANKNWGIPQSILSGNPLNSDPKLAAAMNVNKSSPFVVTHSAPSEDQLKNFFGYKGEKNGDTERSKAVDAMKQLEDRAQNVTTALKQMGQGMEAPTALTAEWVKTFALVETAIDKIGNALDPVSVKLQGIANDMKDAAGALASPSFASLGSLPGVQAIGRSFTTGGLTSRVNGPEEQALPGMTAANEAAMRYAKTQEYVTEGIAYDYQGLRSQLLQFGIHLGNVGERMQGVILTLADAATNFAMELANRAGGSGGGAGTGRGLGGLLGSAAGFFLGGPVGGAVGKFVGTAAGGLIGGLFDHAKKSTDAAANSMTALAKTTDRLNASISNMPQWFKIAGFRFAATSPIGIAPPPPAYTPPTPNAPSGPTGGTPTDGATSNRSPSFHIQTLNVNSSATNVRQLLAEIEKAAFEKQATGAASGFAFSFQGT